VIASAGGLPVIAALTTVGALVLWVGRDSETMWTAIPARDLFQLALEREVAAVVVDGARTAGGPPRTRDASTAGRRRGPSRTRFSPIAWR